MRTLRLNMGIVLVSLLVIVAGALVSAGSADAGRGGKNGGSASIRLNETDPDRGEWVTFTASGGSRIAVACYKDGSLYMLWSADQAVGTAFHLGGTDSRWVREGGTALCYAWLYKRDLSRGFEAVTSFWAGDGG